MFEKWIAQETAGCDPPATIIDLHSWLGEKVDMVRLQLIFVVEHADEVFKLMQTAQVSVASSFVPPKEQRRAKPGMHRVYDHMHNLHTTLRQVADSKKIQPGIESLLTRKNGSGGDK